MPANIEKIRDEIVLALLPEVPFDGWSWDAAARAAQKAGYDAQMAAAVFPGKCSDLLVHFADWTDRQMLARLPVSGAPSPEGLRYEDLRVRERITLAVETRFAVLRPYKESERQALAYWVRPFRKWAGGRLLWRTADRIWIWAGDTASDYNHYTKRSLLSAVISATALAWLNDDTPDDSITRAFLARRIETVMRLGKFAGTLGKFKKRGG